MANQMTFSPVPQMIISSLRKGRAGPEGSIAGITVALHNVPEGRVTAEYPLMTTTYGRLVMSPVTYRDLQEEASRGDLTRIDEVLAIVREAEEQMKSVVRQVGPRRAAKPAATEGKGTGFHDLDVLHAQIKAAVGSMVAHRQATAEIGNSDAQISVLVGTYSVLRSRYEAIKAALLETEGLMEVAAAVVAETMGDQWHDGE